MTTRTPGFTRKLPAAVALAAAALLTVSLIDAGQARAATAPVDLGGATSFAVVGGHGVANTGRSVITGDVGVGPNSAIRGLGPGTVKGVRHVADAGALHAQTDVATAYNDAAGRTPVTAVPAELGGTTLFPGIYASGPLAITGTVTLDAQNATDAVFVLQADRLTTAVDSTVLLINGANACDVFWQVGRSATLGKNSVFAGTILALTSITAGTGATIDGRLLAQKGTVRLHHNTITASICAVTPPDTTTTPVPVGPNPTTTTAGTTTTAPGPTTTAAGPTTTATGPTTTTTIPSTTTTTIPSTTTTADPTTTTAIPSTTMTIPGVTTASSAGHIGRASVSGAVVVAAAATTTTLPASTTSTTKPGSPAPGIFPTGTSNGVSPSTTSTSDPPAVVGTAKPLASTGIDVAVTLRAALLAIAVGSAVVWGSGSRMAGSSRSRSRRRTSTTNGVAGSATSTTDLTPAVAATGEPLASTGIEGSVTLRDAVVAIAVAAALVWGSGSRIAGWSRSRSQSRRRT